jgi:hypothetical protein
MVSGMTFVRNLLVSLIAIAVGVALLALDWHWFRGADPQHAKWVADAFRASPTLSTMALIWVVTAVVLPTRRASR